jgi:uncharacterized protein (TIRG00374 family)
LIYAFSRGGVSALGQAFSQASVAVLAPAVACEVVVQLARALKWTAILRTHAPVKFGNVLSAVVLGGASTHLVPLRLDEVLRAGLLGRREGIPMATVLGTVALDRIFEVFVLGILLGVVAMSGDLQPWMRAGAAIMLAGFLVVVVGVLVFLRSEAALQERWAASENPRIRNLGAALGSLAEGLRAFPRGRALAVAIAAAAIEWSAVVALYSWLLHAYNAGTGLAEGILLALGSAFAYAIPNVPGAVGSYEILQTMLIESETSLNAEAALALALTGHAVIIVPITVAGVAVALFEWRRWGSLNAPEEDE